MRKILLGILCLFAINMIAEEAKPATPVVTGFAFFQGYTAERSDPDFTIARVRLWVNSENGWGGHIDVDGRKTGKELFQLFVSKKTSVGTFRVGRIFLADVCNTEPPFLTKTASYPLSEDTLGPFFGNGVQYAKTIGKVDILADIANDSGTRYYRPLDGMRIAGSAQVAYKIGKERYIAGGGRIGNGFRRLSFDSGYLIRNFYFNNSLYYTDELNRPRKVTGISYGEWRATKWIAPHAQYDVPSTGKPISTLGVGIGTMKYVYVALDREWRTGSPSRFAAKAHVRYNF